MGDNNISRVEIHTISDDSHAFCVSLVSCMTQTSIAVKHREEAHVIHIRTSATIDEVHDLLFGELRSELVGGA